MKKTLPVVCLILMVLVFVGCDKKESETSGSKVNDEVLVEEDLPEEVAIEIPDLSSDIFKIDTLTEADLLAIMDEMSYEDSLSASPLFISQGIQMYFKDQSYFTDRQFFVEDLLLTSRLLQGDLEMILFEIDTLIPEVIQAYEDFVLVEPDIGPYLEDIKKTYADHVLALTYLENQISALESKDEDSFNQAWLDFLRIQKQLALTEMAIQVFGRVLHDAEILVASYENTYAQDFNLTMTLDFLKMDLDFAELYDTNVENALNAMATIYHQLGQLEQSDAYMTLGLLIHLNQRADRLRDPLSQLQAREGLTEETIEFAQLANDYQYEATLTLTAHLMEDYDLTLDGVNLSAAMPSLPWMMAGSSAFNEDPEAYSQAAMNQSKAALKEKIEPVKAKKSFWSKLKATVRELPGVVIEKASTAVYNYAFESAAEEYGLSKDVIDAEKKRVKDQEWDRIVKGTAGSTAIKDAIGYLDKVDESIGNLSDYALGSDNSMSKAIKESSKFLIGSFTAGSKGALKLMDQTASPGEIAKASLDVTLTVIGGSTKINALVENSSKKLVSYLGTKSRPISDLATRYGAKLVAGAKKITASVKESGSKVFLKTVEKLSVSPKTNALLSKTVNTLSKASAKLKDTASATFEKVMALTDDFGASLNSKYDDLVAKSTLIDKKIVTDAVGGSMGAVTENYLKGLVYSEIPNLVDNIIPKLVSDDPIEEEDIAGGDLAYVAPKDSEEEDLPEDMPSDQEDSEEDLLAEDPLASEDPKEDSETPDLNFSNDFKGLWTGGLEDGDEILPMSLEFKENSGSFDVMGDLFPQVTFGGISETIDEGYYKGLIVDYNFIKGFMKDTMNPKFYNFNVQGDLVTFSLTTKQMDPSSEFIKIIEVTKDFTGKLGPDGIISGQTQDGTPWFMKKGTDGIVLEEDDDLVIKGFWQ